MGSSAATRRMVDMESLYVRKLSRGEAILPHEDAGRSALLLRGLHVGDAAPLYAVYSDAFSSRPGALLSETAWTTKWPLHPLCVARLSTVALDRGALVGYALAYVDARDALEGYIGQVGVRCAHQHRGVGASMIARTLRAFSDEGLSHAALRGSADNTRAIRLYERLGFVRQE